MPNSTLKQDLLAQLKTCPKCHRLDVVLNRLSIDSGQTLYTGEEVLWIVQMVTGTESKPAGGRQGIKQEANKNQ